ncbi:unnamed protein product [Peronospora effusa]|nr:unnamed protein product [Peronospora effusa]
MTKKRRKLHPHLPRTVSTTDICLRIQRDNPLIKQSTAIKCSKSGVSSETVAHFQALQRSPDAVALADVFEWCAGVPQLKISSSQ